MFLDHEALSMDPRCLVLFSTDLSRVTLDTTKEQDLFCSQNPFLFADEACRALKAASRKDRRWLTRIL